ncbi:glycosyltransferase [Bacillus cereus]|nr:glycosyltransferase [Bacillus cereus]PFJ48747.1 glycosyltransferase [Bacillus cereus]PFK05256.1 glycosyltransferase [Bacillus cereus]PFW19774.1 glycosyltransferase [Bacillus cereus]PGM85792.1 glycosyltransferase [Bacillus cereus]
MRISMRILQIVDNLAIKSGVSSVVMNLYRNIDRNLVQFDFLVMNKVEISYENEIKEMGGNIYYVRSPLTFKTIIGSIFDTKKFFKRYAREYDVVHLHSPTTVIFNLSFAKYYKIPNRIVHSHSTMFSKNKVKKFINFLLCLNLKRYANIYWACSIKAGEFLFGKKYIQKNKVKIINNAIDLEDYAFNKVLREKYRQELGISNKYVVGHVASFNEIKNHTFLIDAFHNVCQHNDDSVLVLVGDGPMYHQIIDLVRSMGIEDKVIFLGFRKDISVILNIFDVFVLPSLKEGLPVCAVEAQASGLPCFLSSSITREVDLGNVEYLDLDIETWVAALKRNKQNKDRDLTYDLLHSTAFNIKKEAKRVEKFYTKMHNREKNL